MKKLRIAVWHNLPSGGGKRQLYYHVRGLIQRGHYVESWCPPTADQNFLPLKDILRENVIHLNTSKFQLGNTQSKREITCIANSLEAHSRICAKQIHEGGFDILLSGACSFFRTSFMAKYVCTPSVLYLGEPLRYLYEANPELPWISASQKNFGLMARIIQRVRSERQFSIDALQTQAKIEIENAKKYTILLVNSQYSRESILRSYNIESRVCYLGVDTDFYISTNEPRGEFILGVGTIYQGKGIDRAIYAIATLEEKKRPPLIWIGNGANEYDMNYFIKLAESLCVKIIFKINISDKEIISLYSRAKVMIYTSRLEPFGFAPLEANACGTPVVAIAEGGVRETIRNNINGFLAPEYDPKTLGKLISKFIDDPLLSNAMMSRCREYVYELWNLKICIDNIESQLFRAVEGG
jgi:glycosyltransferase involved in cell wall biosynthesis